MYNTSFWSLIQLGGLDNKEAEKTLAVSSHQYLSRFWLIVIGNSGSGQERDPLFPVLNKLQQRTRDLQKGQRHLPRCMLNDPYPCSHSANSEQYELVDPNSHNVVQMVEAQAEPLQQSKTQKEKDRKSRAKARIVVEHLDIIKDEFWDRRPWLLSGKPGKIPKEP